MTETNKGLPVFNNLDEEAAYWDSNGFVEQWNNGKPIKVVNGKKFTEGLSIRFPVHVMGQLREKAQETGVGTGTRVRMWVLERLHGKL